VSIVDNLGGVPTYIPPSGATRHWSTLAKILEGLEPPFPEPTPSIDQYILLGTTALYTAWAGTVLAQQALTVAYAGTDLAYTALQTAWAGTALMGGTQAYDALVTAWEGTAAANSAIALANQAFVLAYQGTMVGDTAYSALTTAWSGTETAQAAIGLANSVYPLAYAGTNAISLANQALITAWTGTQAFDIAVAGTNAAALCVLRAGDTMTGTLTTPNVFYTHGTSSNAGTVQVDFNGEALKTVTVSAATAFDGTNYLPAHAVTYRCLVSGTAAEIPVTFNSNFAILNEIPTGFTTNKIAVVSFTAFGSTANDVVVAYAQQA
jgi:hypothetical protein